MHLLNDPRWFGYVVKMKGFCTFSLFDHADGNWDEFSSICRLYRLFFPGKAYELSVSVEFSVFSLFGEISGRSKSERFTKPHTNACYVDYSWKSLSTVLLSAYTVFETVKHLGIRLIRDRSFITSWGGGGVICFKRALFWGGKVIFYPVRKVRGVKF